MNLFNTNPDLKDLVLKFDINLNDLVRRTKSDYWTISKFYDLLQVEKCLAHLTE